MTTYYNQTVDTIDKVKPLIDREIIRLNANELNDDWYNGLLFFKGMSCYNLQDYKTSTTIFKYLIKSDNKNDSYRNWYRYSRYGQNIWLVRFSNILSASLILGVTIFKQNLSNFYVKQTLLIIGILGLCTTSGIEYYIKKSKRKRPT